MKINYFQLLKWKHNITTLLGLLLKCITSIYSLQFGIVAECVLSSNHFSRPVRLLRDLCLSMCSPTCCGRIQVALYYHSAEEQSVSIGRFERTCCAANFFPKFPKPLGQGGDGPGDLVSSKSIQRALATTCAVQGTVALSQVRSIL